MVAAFQHMLSLIVGDGLSAARGAPGGRSVRAIRESSRERLVLAAKFSESLMAAGRQTTC